MKIKFVIPALMLIPFFFSCKKNDDKQSPAQREIIDRFDTSMQSWSADFSDYPKDSENFYELKYSLENLPAPLNQEAKGIRISGNNHSDDLFMFIKKKISGLIPNQTYKMKIEVQLASNARKGDFGAGGSPGSGVILKSGMTAKEPLKTLNDRNSYILNIDKGNQSVGGADVVVLGDIDNGSDKPEYNLVQSSGEFTGKTDSNGEAWVMIGTDSGYEGITSLYYTKVKATFTAVN
jgi:hypothetical protein